MVVLSWLPLAASGVERFDTWLAKVNSFEGRVESQRVSSQRWQAVAVDETYFKGDGLRTLDRSRARLQLPNETFWDLDQNSRINLTDAPASGEASEGNFLLELWEGMALFRSRQSKSVNFRTPRLNGANHGTEFLVEASDDATIVTVYDGVVETWNEHGKLSVSKGHSTIARKGQAPQPYLRVKPEDAVQWALYYPPVVDFGAVSKTGLAPPLIESLARHRHNDLSGALAALDQVLEADRTAVFHNLRAGLLLTAGRVDEAETDIRQALKLHSNDATATAQQAIVAVACNDKDQALALAKRASTESPRSVPAKLALSYAHQARFELEQALASARQAVELEPDNALAHARLAEMQLSLGRNRQAETAARQALKLDPGHARAKALLGFARLMQRDTEEALRHFDEAVRQNPSDPLNRFGLGLAKIHGGELKAGTEELEQATSLDPNDSLLRSYLGKAYYEQKRSEPAAAEYQRARELDPKDPTPYFYEAIKKQTENRPVEALRDLQTAIDLNGNRAVYRSRQMLDSDLAARSAALGRVYGDLGFGPRALVEGWTSVATDPTDFAGHRLLADSYSALPRHDVARISELWVSQLLQPANLLPVQPHLAERDLLFLSSAGPQSLSFNEFNPLFARNRLGVQMSGLVGNNDTYADEITQSGIWGPLSYSLGQFHYQTRGFRTNNLVDQNVYNAFIQAKVSPNLNVIFEARHRDVDYGDLTYLWDLSEPFDNKTRTKLNVDTVKFGGNYSISERSHFLTAFSYQNVRNLYDKFASEGTGSYLGEWQYLHHGNRFDWIVGQGILRANDNFRFFGYPNETAQATNVNGYVYSNIRFPGNVTWTLGMGVNGNTDISGNSFRRVEPKFGVRWQITKDLTLRGAVFNANRHGLFFNDQTIEPTQIAGFNQFYNDRDSTRSRRLGLGLDQRVADGLYLGVEASRRDLGVFDQFGNWAHWREQLYRGYLNWTPTDWASVSVEYQDEYFWSDAVNTNTHMLPVTLRVFDSSGLFGKLGVTYVSQKFNNYLVYSNSWNIRDQDEFALVDMGVGYRLPKRYGIFRVEVRNLLNQKFNYYGDNFRVGQEIGGEVNPLFMPDRTIFGQLTLSF
jgi:tetratricopeptide (TPR) repeat protein